MAEAKAKPVKAEEQYSKTVRIKLFKDSKNYKDDLVVGLNGKIFKIQRGVWVEVPRAVAEIIAHQEEQDTSTALMIEGLEAEFNAKASELG